MKYLIYCILREMPTWTPPLPAGVTGKPVSIMGDGILAVVCSHVPGETDETDIRKITAYSQVITLMHELCPILPIRYGCLLDHKAQILEFLKNRRMEILEALETLAGCAEMGIRVLAPPDDNLPPPDPCPSVDLSSGKEYLARRETYYSLIDLQKKRSQIITEKVKQKFNGLFLKCRDEFSSVENRGLLSLYFLTKKEDVKPFRRTFSRLGRDVKKKLLLSGPWPPYNFVPPSLSEAKSLLESEKEQVPSGATPPQGKPKNNPLIENQYDLYDKLMDAIPSSVLVIDREYRVVFANLNFLKKNKCSKSNTIGRPFHTVFPSVIFNDLGLGQNIRRVFQTRCAVMDQQLSYRAPGIPLKIYSYNIIPVTAGKEVDKVILLIEDVTARIQLTRKIRQIEHHLAWVVQSASDLVVSTDPEGRVTSWNRAAENLTGCLSPEAEGQPFFSFFSAPDREKVKRAFDLPEDLENPSWPEWSLLARDRSEILCSWVCSAMRDETGKRVGIVAVGRNLTEYRKMELQVFQAQKLASLGVMAGGIAHELRNPLAVSSATAQMLLDRPAPPEFVQECAEKVYTGIQRASTIIDNLVQLARPTPITDKMNLNLADVIKNVLTLLASQAEQRNVHVLTRFPQEPVLLDGNLGLLEQLGLNLILNAFDAMPKGGTLEVTLAQEDHQARFTVRDTGLGIPAAQVDKIFDPFFTTKMGGKNMGLGLSLCHVIVKQHQGAIGVESKEHAGTTVTIRLPLTS
jgi:PAS domain S-box-containing protein